jgi:hypothetical protein
MSGGFPYSARTLMPSDDHGPAVGVTCPGPHPLAHYDVVIAAGGYASREPYIKPVMQGAVADP